MPRVKFEITQECIDRGFPDPEHCPVALAIRERVGILECVVVGDDKITIGDADYDCPPEVVEFIAHFDGGFSWEPEETPAPLAFELDVDNALPIFEEAGN